VLQQQALLKLDATPTIYSYFNEFTRLRYHALCNASSVGQAVTNDYSYFKEFTGFAAAVRNDFMPMVANAMTAQRRPDAIMIKGLTRIR
jgi:hypothetical protein